MGSGPSFSRRGPRPAERPPTGGSDPVHPASHGPGKIDGWGWEVGGDREVCLLFPRVQCKKDVFSRVTLHHDTNYY